MSHNFTLTHPHTHTNFISSQIQKQVHPRLEIEDEAVAYLESLIYQLLAQMCAAQPHSIKDVEIYVQNNFAPPIDTWALSDAQLLMERAQKKRGGYVFPVDKMFPQLQKVREKNEHTTHVFDAYCTVHVFFEISL